MIRLLALLLSLVAAAHAAPVTKRGLESADPEAQARIKVHYQKAFDLYKRGGYSQAILEWSKILEIDPTQSSAKKMIRTAREQIDARDRKRQQSVFDHIDAGKYQEAFIALQKLLERDPTHPLYKKLESRLDAVIDIVPRSPSHRKAWQMAVKGLDGFLSRKEDMQLAYNGLRYAIELDPKTGEFTKLLKLVTDADPGLLREKLPKGTTILVYKRKVALGYIYDGKYLLAINLLREVLQLEPNDLVALKRLGSSYYALGRYKDARAVWLRALRVHPGDKMLQDLTTRLDRKLKK